MNKKLTGVFIPVITPFTDQKVDLGKLAHNIEKADRTSIAGYMPLGSNGEFAHMDDEEQLSVLRAIKRHAGKDKILMVGIARQSAYSTIEFGEKVINEGIDFVSVLTPSYFTALMTDDALIRYYSTVADRVSVPVLLYNCPKFAAGLRLTEAVVAELAKHPNIAGMKDTSKGNIVTYLSITEKEDFEVVAGGIENFLEGLEHGGSGGVLSMANYQPEECARIYQLFVSGRTKEAGELSDRLIALNKAGAGKYGVAGVKAGCDIFGFQGGEVRIPLQDCTAEQRKEIRKAFADAGYPV
jgi:4-hydroxy-2-oxoglutarate aldolase